MNRKLLPQLKEIKVSDKATALLRVQTAIAAFGHGSISLQEAADYGIDMKAEAVDRGWDVYEATLVYVAMTNSRGYHSYTKIPVKKRG